MSYTAPISATVLVISDNLADAYLVQSMLKREFSQVVVSTDLGCIADDVKHYRPDVLLLAFNSVEKSERHHLTLTRECDLIHHLQHQTIMLCNKDEVQHAYALCRKGLIDDYILFWPMTLDAPRLPMAIHRALRTLTVQSRQQADLVSLLEQKADEGQKLVATVEDSIHLTERSVSAVLDRLLQILPNGANSSLPGKQLAAFGHSLEQFRKSVFHQQFHEVTESFRMLKEWIETLSRGPHPSHAKFHAAEEDVASPIPTILVVDDDEFQRKMVGQILKPEQYRLLFAASGLEALELIQETTPDLILMDVMMPGINGIETLKQIKAIPTFEQVPVIMLTGRSEGPVVIESMKAGAQDFVVKPFDRGTLISKVASLVSTCTPSLP